MRLFLLSVFFFFGLQSTLCFSQTEYIEVNSSILKETRKIKIQLPRNYNSTDKKYPVIIVLDGDYMFEPFAGNVDYLSYWEIIPEAIVVGINQAGHREKDGRIDPDNGFPSATGADFFEFIGYEVLKFIDDNYRTAPFSVIAGIDYMANFSSFYLLKDNPLFSGYISLSPDVTSQLPEHLNRKLEKIDRKIWYYLSTADEDIPSLKIKIEKLNSLLSNLKNPNLNYQYQVFENANHFSFIPRAIPQSLLFIFAGFRPVTESEYESKFLTADSPTHVLEDKYLSMEELYAIQIPIRIKDFLKTEEAIIEKEIWEDYKNLSRLARKKSPNTVLHNYFEGRYYEKIGQPKRAIKEYQAAYGLESAGNLTSDFLLNKADELYRIFGN